MIEQAYFMSYQMPRDGYGYAGIKIGQALRRVAPRRWRSTDMLAGRAWGDVRVGQVGWRVYGPAVVMTVPRWWADVSARPLVGYTMFEATRMPAGRVAAINECVACLVPCQWCAESFREQGVRVPLEVAPWGIDPQDYYYLDRSNHEGPYMFLWSGTPDRRKGWDLVYRAFCDAFGDNMDAVLVMHFRRLPNGLMGVRDRNVELIEGLFDRPRLRAMLHAADCYVFPSRGEGWGLPPREAAATGLPVIATNWGGLAEEIEHWAYPLEHGMSRASFGPWADDLGQWAEPNYDHLVERMRWCFEHRGEAARFGDEAAAWIASNTPWERTARRIDEVLEGLA